MPYMSPGAEASGAIFDFLSEREKAKQLAIRNQIEIQRMQMERDSAAELHQQRMEQMKLQNELRQQQMDEKSKAETMGSLEDRFNMGDMLDPSDPDVLKAKQLGILPHVAKIERYSPVASNAPLNPTVPTVGGVTQTLPAKPPGIRFLGSDAQRKEAKADASFDALMATIPDGPQKSALRIAHDYEKSGHPLPAGVIEALGGMNNRAAVNMQRAQGTVNGKPAFANYHPDTGKFTDVNGQEIPGFVPQEAGGDPNKRLDQAFAAGSKQLDVLRKPFMDQANLISRLETNLNQGTAQADALMAPELLTAMAGGQGAGLRMSEAEISRIVHGRSVWEELKAKLQMWATDPSKAQSITPAQRQQIRQLMIASKEKMTRRLGILDQAEASLIASEDVDERRRIIQQTHKALTEEVLGSADKEPAAGGGATATPAPAASGWVYDPSANGGRGGLVKKGSK